MPRLPILVWLCLAAAATAQEPAEPEPETPAEAAKPTVRDAVDAGNYFFQKAFAERDARAIADLYTEEGRVIAPGAEPAAGRAAIAAFWTGAMQETTGVRLETLSVESGGDLAIEEGLAHLTANDESVSAARYVVVWKRVGRRWYLHRDIWNAGPGAEPPGPESAIMAPAESETR
jgi:uncharacterized protein (TIGR02246 family)